MRKRGGGGVIVILNTTLGEGVSWGGVAGGEKISRMRMLGGFPKGKRRPTDSIKEQGAEGLSKRKGAPFREESFVEDKGAIRPQ